MRAFALIVALALAAGCATELPPQPASFDAVLDLRRSDIRQVSLGEFKPGPELPHSGDASVAVRAGGFRAPGGSFALYLRDTIRSQLVSSGKLGDAKDRILSAELVRSEVETSLPNSSAVLAARFTVTQQDGRAFTKTLTVSDEWPSSFFGAIAITEAGQRYSALYQSLAVSLFRDPDMLRALSAPVAPD